VNVFPIQAPPEDAGAKCPNCGASVVADQRYCLTCGQPCSPVRLAFLDVLQPESEGRVTASIVAPPNYLPPLQEPDGAIGWLRRYSGLFGLLAVLLTTGLIGLLVGHWMTPSKAAGPQVVRIEGGALPVAGAPAAGSSSTPAASPSSAGKTSSKPSAATEAQEVKEVKEAESPKAKLKAPAKTNASSLSKLEKLTGKRHEKEIEKLTEGGQPIETGG
jgi:hypothetical protein